MADIHVETKKHNTTPAWIWILITLAIVVVVAYFLTRNDTTNQNTGVNNSKATSYVQPYTESDANVVYYAG
jgi:lipopolysaccharide export system protein LptC